MNGLCNQLFIKSTGFFFSLAIIAIREVRLHTCHEKAVSASVGGSYRCIVACEHLGNGTGRRVPVKYEARLHSKKLKKKVC